MAVQPEAPGLQNWPEDVREIELAKKQNDSTSAKRLTTEGIYDGGDAESEGALRPRPSKTRDGPSSRGPRPVRSPGAG